MDIHARTERLHEPAILLNAASDADRLQHFVHAAGSHNIYLYAQDAGTVCISTVRTHRGGRLSETRQSLKSSLAYLAAHSPVANIWRDIRQHARSDSGGGDIVVDRDTLLRVLDKNRNSPWAAAARYQGHTLREAIEQDIAPTASLLKKELSAHAAQPDRPLDTLQLETIGRAWEASCLRHYARSPDRPDAAQQHQFRLLLQAVPESQLVDAVSNYCDAHFSARPTKDRLAAIAGALVREFKAALSSADCHAWTDADVAGEIRIGSHSYAPVGSPKQGGFGIVQVYADRASPADTIAAKFPKEADMHPQLAEECRIELAGHLLATREPHPNVVGLKGAARVGDGLTLLVEDCSGGHLLDVSKRLAVALDDGKISPRDYRGMVLTLARDMLAGLNQLHTRSGLTHGDVKLANVFLGVDGQAKVGDFDRAALGETREVPTVDLPVAIQYLSPEIVRRLSDYFDALDPIARLPESADKRRQLAALRKTHTASLSRGSDCFAAGIALYELCYGVNPFERRRVNRSGGENSEDTRQQLLEFSTFQSVRERFDYLFDRQPIAKALEADETQLQRMIFSLMARDPDYRGSATTALLFPVFGDADIGSDAMRDILRSLARDTP